MKTSGVFRVCKISVWRIDSEPDDCFSAGLDLGILDEIAIMGNYDHYGICGVRLADQT
jgi:hypothetical protein